jgi:hypothetical protein
MLPPMISPGQRLCRLPLLFAVLFSTAAGFSADSAGAEDGTDRWFFEGVVERVPDELGETIRTGWRLEGSFLFTALNQELVSESAEGSEGRLVGGVADLGFALTEYYQPLVGGAQGEGPAGFDYRDNDPAADGRDWMGWFFPLQSTERNPDWEPQWLQVWLFDPEGQLLQQRPPVLSPYGLDWDSAWFRLRMRNHGEDLTADIEGPLRVFDPSLGQPLPSETDRLLAAVEDLAERLRERDRLLQLRTGELLEAKERLRGLRAMVDLLVEERASLEKENERLQVQLDSTDPRERERLAALEAEKALLASELDSLETERDGISSRLAKAESRILRQLDTIRDLEAEVAAAASPEDAPREFPERTIAVAESPMIIEKAVTREKPSAPAKSSGNSKRRSFRPLKFR